MSIVCYNYNKNNDTNARYVGDNMEHYDGTKLLSLRDINGKRPEIYICTTNRTGGKTTYFNRLLFNRFVKTQAKFMLVYRFNYELDDVAEKFFKDIQGLFFPEWCLESKRKARGVYHELYAYLRNDPDIKYLCGYAVSLNNADQLKKYSHLFSDTQCMLMDEFQSETNHYCPNEVAKLMSLHTSVARGQGKAVRYVPVYLIGNPVSIINPYYVALGISARLRSDTKFMKGDGYVVEQGYVESVASAQEESGFNRAFAGEMYSAYSAQGVYLNDNHAFIDKPNGRARYLGTIKYNGKEFALREYAELGIIYCDGRPDATYPFKLAVTTGDHNVNYVMLKRNDLFVQNMRYFFERGAFRFKDLQCKEAVMKMVSY